MNTSPRTAPSSSPRRLLEPLERVSEVLFGLIMVLTFTGSLSVADADRGDVRAMLVGALGCNLAWGIIDGVFYLMGCLSEQGLAIRTRRALRKAATPDEARRAIADVLPTAVAEAIEPTELDAIRRRLEERPAPPPQPRLRRDDLLGAVAVFLWVFATTFPVALPFLLMDTLPAAMRTSNAVAVGLLFVAGFAFGRLAEFRPWLTGLAMVALGSILVALTIALGG